MGSGKIVEASISPIFVGIVANTYTELGKLMGVIVTVGVGAVGNAALIEPIKTADAPLTPVMRLSRKTI